jgi:RNA-directed DNA polymerase
MTAEVNTSAFTTADAPPHDVLNWHAIDWQKAMRNMRRIQARIVKATQAGNWRKVRALQRLLRHSFSGRALAVRRVTENKGKRTAGVDGELWNTPAQKAKGIERLKQKRYRAQPLKRVYIPKSDGKRLRALGIPCRICQIVCVNDRDSMKTTPRQKVKA